MPLSSDLTVPTPPYRCPICGETRHGLWKISRHWILTGFFSFQNHANGLRARANSPKEEGGSHGDHANRSRSVSAPPPVADDHPTCHGQDDDKDQSQAEQQPLARPAAATVRERLR